MIAGAPSDILSSPNPMSLISATIGPVSQETDHTSPALVGSSGARNFLFSWFPFLARLAAPETSSLSGQGRKGSSYSMEDSLVLAKWASTFSSQPKP